MINPTKNELGKISKKIIKKINQEILKKTDVNQWKNTSNVINWIKNIENEKDCSFIQLCIKEFYPSITEEILEEVISFAVSLMDIDDHKITIKHCRKSLLFHNNTAWKKTTTSCFDVTMDSYDGAEVCELVSRHIHLIKTWKHHWQKEYRSLPWRQISSSKEHKCSGSRLNQKDYHKMFKDVGFQLEIKTNDNLLYINISSDHPPQVIKQLTNSINKRFCENSANEQVFNTVKSWKCFTQE